MCCVCITYKTAIDTTEICCNSPFLHFLQLGVISARLTVAPVLIEALLSLGPVHLYSCRPESLPRCCTAVLALCYETVCLCYEGGIDLCRDVSGSNSVFGKASTVHYSSCCDLDDTTQQHPPRRLIAIAVRHRKTPPSQRAAIAKIPNPNPNP